MAKTRFVAVIFSCVLATSGWAETSSPSLVVTPPQPKWSELTVQQKIVLAPLADDWDSLEYFRQKKWLGIVARFPTMTAEEQRRIQGQMQGWGKLSPEKRQLARENFKTANQLPAEKKQELKQKWEEYSNLPEDEKEKLKQQAANKPVLKPGRPTTPAPLPPHEEATVQTPAATAAETTTKP
ncbi:DUF3106 domain-containing protein [Propionivibrio sp.]|uniref:DUF3106 domain-containing protein n=1 Tax=Propionivibrio sp. TaxID=2212460 RepID=UPI00263A2C1E|nr:DUF3106 domain-containing protein [Propionivibrio sp.]